MNSDWDKFLSEELSSKDFRDAYLEDQVRTNIAFQIKTLREQPERDWTKTYLAEKMGTHQPNITRLEDPEYGRVSISTLLKAASAFDVALLVQFVEWDDFLDRMKDVSPGSLRKKPFSLGIPKQEGSVNKSRPQSSKLIASNVIEIRTVRETPVNDFPVKKEQLALDFGVQDKMKTIAGYDIKTA
jgi:transcriptional regulator with XRE-family HTH domain